MLMEQVLRTKIPEPRIDFWIGLLLVCSLGACTNGQSTTDLVTSGPMDAIEDKGTSDDTTSPGDSFSLANVWQEFGEKHMLLSLTCNYVPEGGPQTRTYSTDWADRIEVVLHKTEGPPEILFDTTIFEGPNWGIEHPFTHVSDIAVDDEEDVEFCLSLYGTEGDLRCTGCKQKTIGPGKTGQILWQLNHVECVPLFPYCSPPLTEPLLSLSSDNERPPGLKWDVILSSEAGWDSADPLLVHIGLHPPVSCDDALQFYADDIAGTDDYQHVVDCIEPSDPDFIGGTMLVVRLATTEEAIGLVNQVLNMPNGYPARTLWDEALMTAIEGPLVGVSHGEIGTGKFERSCEYWFCL